MNLRKLSAQDQRELRLDDMWRDRARQFVPHSAGNFVHRMLDDDIPVPDHMQLTLIATSESVFKKPLLGRGRDREDAAIAGPSRPRAIAAAPPAPVAGPSRPRAIADAASRTAAVVAPRTAPKRPVAVSDDDDDDAQILRPFPLRPMSAAPSRNAVPAKRKGADGGADERETKRARVQDKVIDLTTPSP